MSYKLIISNKPISCASMTSITGITISGQQPASTYRSLVFKVGSGSWSKLTIASGIATLTAVATQTLTAASIISEGNTAAEMATVTSVVAFAGQQVYVAFAIGFESGAAAMPTIGIAIAGKTNTDQYARTEYSAELTLASTDVQIIRITPDTTVTGSGTAVVTVSLCRSGTWSDYMALASAAGQKASAVKYQEVCTVPKIGGTDSAKVSSVTTLYCAGASTVSGNTAEIYSITQDYENGLGFAECMVKHKQLIDAQLTAYVAFRSAPKTRTQIQIGTATGEAQTLTLGVGGVTDTGINHNTLRVYLDGIETTAYTGFNTETSQITITAAKGAAITVSYQYGWEAETWSQMTADSVQPYKDSGFYGTHFSYELPSASGVKAVSDIKVVLFRPAGTVTDVVLGTGTGNRQVFYLPHKARKESIVCTGSWSYDYDAQRLIVVAASGTEIKASYNWIAETHEIHGLTCGWAED